ncbi:RNA polymerase sigma factor, partial [Ruminococcus sp.]|uniref:RNA polymerase sigma factor n=1 Tax=Ruminococcus sp. TaxID=41978 RepID=UPI003FF14C47
EDYADNNELIRSLKKFIEVLKPEHRSAVILYYYDGMPLKKVSEILEISENAAKQKLFKARAKIKKEIERVFEGGALTAVPVSIMIRTALPKKYAMTAAAPVTAVKSSTAAVKIVGTAAAVVVAVSIPLALRGVNNNGFGVHDISSSVSESDCDDSVDIPDSSMADTSSEKIPDSSVAQSETDSIPELSSKLEKVTDAAVTTAPVPQDTPVTDTQSDNNNADGNTSTVMPRADFSGEQFFSKTVGEMLKMSDNNYELVYPTFVQNGYDSMYKCAAFPQYHFGRAAYDAQAGKGYVDESEPVTRVELYNGAYVTKDIYVGMTYNELCNVLGEKPLMYLSNTDRNRIVSANINGRTWWFGFDLTDEQLDETYKRMQAQTDSETFELNPYQYGVDISDIDPVISVAVCDIGEE